MSRWRGFWLAYAPKSELDKKRHLVGEWHEKGNAALAVMETHLGGGREWFAGGAYSIADIALYGYTHCAAEGGFDLARYPKVSAWLARVAQQPGTSRFPKAGDALPQGEAEIFAESTQKNQRKRPNRAVESSCSRG